MLLTYAISIVAATVALAQTPPQPACTPPAPLQSLVIPYVGLTSGCTNQAPGNPNCIAGETIQFKVGDSVRLTDCPISYVWQFEDGPVSGLPTMNHQFPAPGVYDVQLTIFQPQGDVHLSATVNVVSPTAIPTLTQWALVFLALVLTAVSMRITARAARAA